MAKKVVVVGYLEFKDEAAWEKFFTTSLRGHEQAYLYPFFKKQAGRKKTLYEAFAEIHQKLLGSKKV